MLFGLLGGLDLQTLFLSMIYRIPAMLIALSFHEAAHAYVAYKAGDPTAKNLGRLTLDPLKHLDVLGTLMILLVGYGWAKPVPVNSRYFKKLRRDDILVSLAGCAVNLVLGFVFLGVLYLLIALGVTNEIVLTIFQYIVWVNIGLGVFNLIPIPPLDGYHVLKDIFIKARTNFFYYYERYGQFILLILIFSGATRYTIVYLIDGIYNLFQSFYSLFIH